MNSSIIKYFGGKFNLAKTIINFFPKHLHYVEPFCGGCHVLFKKEYKSKYEFCNDVDPALINLYRVIQSNVLEFYNILKNLELIKSEFIRQKEILKSKQYKNNIEYAVAFFYIKELSFNGLAKCCVINNEQKKRYKNKIEKLFSFSKRLETVVFSNESFQEVFNIEGLDKQDTLFYCDPPYTKKTRGSFNDYTYEMDDEQHKELVNTLLKLNSMCVLSGYKNQFYYKLERNGWMRLDFDYLTSCNHKKRILRKESIWLNPLVQQRLKLGKQLTFLAI